MGSFLRTTSGARLLLLAACLTCAVGMLGPFQGVEEVLIPWDKAAHFIAFYGVTILLFLAFPRRRRLDLALLATFGGCATEVFQMIEGRDAELWDMAADACGALAVLAPGYIEQARVALRAGDGARRASFVPERRRGALARLRETTTRPRISAPENPGEPA